jgi:endonuclease/exonuclease/phosphatase family metal-dependent hydrolase
MRLATFNLENLFDRAKILNRDLWPTEGKAALKAYDRVSELLEHAVYSDADQAAILAGLDELGVLAKDDAGDFVLLRQNHGKLLKRPNAGPVEVVAAGRGSWIGWLELKTEKVGEIALQNTARVVRDVAADVLTVIEADSRLAMRRFNEELLPTIGGTPFAHVMLIDGNDDRGIDVGILAKPGFEILSIRSHVDDAENGQTIFSRDCPEYTIGLPSGEKLLVLPNHLKSKLGTPAVSNERRKRQATEVKAIYDARRAEGWEYVAITGDLNDTPTSDPLSPLLGAGSDLKDVSTHPNYVVTDGRIGTYANCAPSQKIDYILMSPELFAKVTGGQVFRMGVWGGTNGTLFPHYPEMTEPVHAASDHAAVWVDLAL